MMAAELVIYMHKASIASRLHISLHPHVCYCNVYTCTTKTMHDVDMMLCNV